MFYVKYNDTVLECDKEKYHLHPKNSHYDPIANTVRCNEETTLERKQGCNLFLGNQACVGLKDRYKAYQTYFYNLNKIITTLGHREIIRKDITEQYEYNVLSRFYNILHNTTRIDLDHQTHILFRHTVDAIEKVYLEYSKRELYREKCGCVYDTDHEGRIALLKNLSRALLTMISSIGEEVFKVKCKDIPPTMDIFLSSPSEFQSHSLPLKPGEISPVTTRSVIGLELFLKLYYKPNKYESSEVQLFLRQIETSFYLILKELVREIHTLCRPIQIAANGKYEGTPCIGSLFTHFSSQLCSLLQTDIHIQLQTLLSSESTYIDYSSCVIEKEGKIVDIQLDASHIHDQVLIQFGYDIHPSYLSILLEENKQSSYETCLVSYKHNNREKFTELCTIIDTLTIDKEIKVILINLCSSFHSLSAIKQISLYPRAANVWTSMSRTKTLVNKLPATGLLEKDLPNMSLHDLKELMEALRQLETRARAAKKQKLEFD